MLALSSYSFRALKHCLINNLVDSLSKIYHYRYHCNRLEPTSEVASAEKHATNDTRRKTYLSGFDLIRLDPFPALGKFH